MTNGYVNITYVFISERNTAKMEFGHICDTAADVNGASTRNVLSSPRDKTNISRFSYRCTP